MSMQVNLHLNTIYCNDNLVVEQVVSDLTDKGGARQSARLTMRVGVDDMTLYMDRMKQIDTLVLHVIALQRAAMGAGWE